MTCQNYFFLGLPPIGIPMYSKGISTFSQFNIVDTFCMNSLFRPTPLTLVLEKFTLSPNTNSKLFKITFITFIFWTWASEKKRISSVNCNNLTFILFLPTITPTYRFLLITCLTNPARPSTTTRNRNGAKGSPYLKPLVGEPLTRIDTEDDSMYCFILPTHWVQYGIGNMTN